jgi:2-keto-4-pentenoate hydratase
MADAPHPDMRAAAFVAARREARAAPVYPGAWPLSEAEAYAVQADAIALWPDSVAGWKVGLIQPPFAQQLGRSRLFGPVFARHVVAAAAGPAVFPCIPNGFAAVEAEYVLKIGADVLPLEGWVPAQAADLVSAVHIGVELAGSPFPGINDHGPLVTISDFGNNAGLILGPELEGGLAALEDHRCAMWIDGVKIADGAAAGIPGGPLGSLVELLNHNGRMGTMLPAGTLVSTGAATGVHQVRIGQQAVADFGADGRIAVAMVEASA